MRIGQWVAKQFDGGVTSVGALIALGLVGSCLGAVFSLASGFLISAAILGAVFVFLVSLLFVAARASDTTIHMSASERRAVWKRLPAFAKHSVLAFFVGNIAGSLLGLADSPRLGHLVSWVAIGASMLVLAEGVRKHRPALPRPKGEPLTSESVAYDRVWKQALVGIYATGAISFAIAAIVGMR